MKNKDIGYVGISMSKIKNCSSSYLKKKKELEECIEIIEHELNLLKSIKVKEEGD